MKQNFAVSGMSCAHCAAHVENAVKGLSGVRSVTVSLEDNAMSVDFDEAALNLQAIVGAVEEEGYGAEARA